MSRFHELAVLPPCILAVDAQNGGSWWSRLRPAMPRDFSEGYRWDALQAAMYSSLPWTSDYHFTFDFTVADDFENGSYWIMYQSNGRISFALDKDARGCRFVFGSYSFNGGVFVYAPFASSLAGRHEVTLTVEGATLRVTVDGTVYEQSGERVESSAYNRVVTTSAPVTLHAVSLTDDSTGTAVWQAAYSDLNDTSNPWPSPVPRNFAEEPATWYDLGLASSTIGMDDWEIGGELYANSLTAGKSIIYRSSNPRFGLYVTSSSQIIFVNYSATGGSERIYYYDNPPTGEWLSFKMQRAGGWLRWLINDIDVNSVEKTGLYVEMNNTSPFFVNENCNLRNCYFKNLTTGRTVWSYPSEAERVRLITKTNVRTDRGGGFETADASMMSRIATQLDLRGAYAEKTFIADCWFPATTNNGTLNYFPMITQGDGLSGSGSSLVVNLSVQADYRASAVGKRFQLTWADASGSVHTTNVVVTDAFFGKRHRIVGVIRPGASSAQYINELYIDGEFVGSGSGSVSSFVFGKAAAASIAPDNLHLIERDYTGFLSQSSLLYGALIFDRALSAAEIAALS